MPAPSEPSTCPKGVLPRFARFLCQHREEITDAWIDAVRRNPKVGSSDGLDYQALADHLPVLFDDLADLLRGEAVDAQVARDAESHGAHRWQQDYSLREVVQELGIVCRLVLQRGLDAFEDENPDAPRTELRRARECVLRFFEETSAASVRRYVDQQHAKQDALHAQLRAADQVLARALQSEHDLLADVFSRSPSFMAVLKGPDHVFELVNDRYTQLVGRRDLLHRAVRDALPEVVAQGFVDLLDGVYRTGEPFVGDDLRVCLQNEPGQPPQERFVDFVYQPTRAPDGTVDGVFVHGVEHTARKLALRALAEASEQRRLALDSARMGWWRYDLVTGKIFSDDRFRAIFGVEREPLAYEQVLARMHPDDRARVDTAVQAAVRPHDPQPYAVEYRVVNDDGSIRWVLARGQATFEEGGETRRATHFAGTVLDITTDKTAQDALRESEARHRLAIEGAQLGTFSWELPSRRVRWNARMKEMFFLPPEAEVSLDLVLSRLHPDDREQTRRAMEAAIAGTTSYQAEYRAVSPDGRQVRWLYATGYPTIDPATGETTGLQGVTVDITAQKNVQANLRELADAMPQIVWSARPDGGLDYTNRRWYEYIARTEAEVSPADWADRVHPDDLAGAGAAWAQALTTGRPYATEFRLRRADGDFRWFLVRALPIRDAAGQITRWHGTCTDIHEARALLEQNAQLLASERAARAEAERTGHLKDEFLATLSHELRTPLNAILGWTQVLQGDPANSEDVEQGLATIERNARVQNGIIEDLLDMSRIISGKVRLEMGRIDLAAVIEAALETVRPAADAKSIRLQPVLDPQAREVSGDPDRLQQVFWNLLSNAIKFTSKGGRVQVILERIHSHLEVNVIDSGEGIAPEFLPHVFDRFRQADASSTRRHGGLGLGLAIVKQLVELHGGSVHVDSAGPGHGTAFRVMLPLRAVQVAEEPPPEEPRASGAALAPPLVPAELLRLTGIRVLVVDDEPDARALVKRLLEDRGATVRTAGSADEAMSLFRENPPDVLVSDIGMPGEDGYSLIRRVRALLPEQGGHIPAIALTAYARSEDRIKAIVAGFQMHLAKPVEAMELLAQVASLMGRTGTF